jgi:hypothetical protein
MPCLGLAATEDRSRDFQSLIHDVDITLAKAEGVAQNPPPPSENVHPRFPTWRIPKNGD